MYLPQIQLRNWSTDVLSYRFSRRAEVLRNKVILDVTLGLPEGTVAEYPADSASHVRCPS